MRLSILGYEQLVFEDVFRPETPLIWLARGAPKRWFTPGAGFGIDNVPTFRGRVSYRLSVDDVGKATYSVTSPEDSKWVLRWPGEIKSAQCGEGCQVTAVENAHGIVTVESAAPQFTVQAQWQ